MLVVEYMHIAGTIVGLVMGVPALVKNAKNRYKKGKENPLNEISFLTVAIMTIAGLARLPNILRGLIKSVMTKNSESIRRFILLAVATSFVTMTFYGILILMALFRDAVTSEEQKKKHVIQIVAAVSSLCIFLLIGYLVHGLCFA